MTGGGYVVQSIEEYELDAGGARHGVQWVGRPGVKGPGWAKLPLLTVGMLGTQVVWSIEMGYASPFLLELGLSKSWMSMVFMAGPLSGLIVQPLIGAYADRSRSRFGRRRPFMLAGCGIAAFAMMLLGWSREVADLFGLGAWAAIACAVAAIYLIDFSINAVMSTDRALIVDTLPPSQQEDGNAWAGRMCGIGGVAGFFVGNIDLTQIVPFLGRTQLQILSFLTGTVLILAHTTTSWAVTERVLLRDDREQSKAGLLSSLRAIWDNIFTLPPSIRTVCFVQFFANLGWYPILFFTSIWVSDIYKHQFPQGEKSRADWEADAVRAGSRALFFQAVVTIIVSVGAPFLVDGSGVQAHNTEAAYMGLGNGEEDEGDIGTPNSATWKRLHEDRAGGTILQRVSAKLDDALKAVRTGSAWALPIKGLTLIRLWIIAQLLFSFLMLCTWWTSTVGGAYCLIAICGFSWALAQWAPYALLGELVLVDTSSNSAPMHHLRRASAAEVVFDSRTAPGADTPPLSGASTPGPRRPSHETIDSAGFDSSPRRLPKLKIPHSTSGEFSGDLSGDFDETRDTVVIRHSDEVSVTSGTDMPLPLPSPPAPEAANTADKAGVILGIHNVFIVLPQFVITFVSSFIFRVMGDGSGEGGDAGAPGTGGGAGAEVVSRVVHHLASRAESAVSGAAKSPDAVGLIFRIGGVAAAGGAYLTWRLSQRWQRGQA